MVIELERGSLTSFNIYKLTKVCLWQHILLKAILNWTTNLSGKKNPPNIRNIWNYLFSLEKRRWRVHLINAYKHLKEGHQEHGASHHPVVPGNSTKVETDAEEVPPEHGKELPHYAGDWALEQATPRCCGFFLTGDIQELPGNHLVQCAPGRPYSSRQVGPDDPTSGPIQLQQFRAQFNGITTFLA